MEFVSAIDAFEIFQLLTRVSHLVDRGEAHEAAECFTDDGEVVASGLAVEVDHSGTHTGREALESMMSGVYGLTQGHGRHWNGLPVLTSTPTGVEADHYLLVVRAGQTPLTGIYLTGTYRDTCVKVNGRWLIARRVIEVDPQPLQRSTVPIDPLIVAFDRIARG